MSTFMSLDGTVKTLRADSARGVNRARNYAYALPFNFTALASGASATPTQKVTASGAFVLGAITGSFYDTATGARPVAAAAPYGDLEALTVTFSMNDGQFMANPLPWRALVGTAENPFYWVGIAPVFAPGANVVVTIANATGKTLTGSVVFIGHILGT